MSHGQDMKPEFVFVGGVPRSGTTLVQKVLDLHPNVYGGPELGLLSKLMPAYEHMAGEIEVGKLAMLLDRRSLQNQFQRFVLGLYEERIAESDVRVISEKTPDNLLVFETLAEAFPSSRFVWVVRDPRDVLSSFRSVRSRGLQKGWNVPYGRSLTADLDTIDRFLAAGEAFRQEYGDRLHVIHYEKLVQQPAETVAEMCTTLRISFDRRMLMTEQPTDISKAIIDTGERFDVYYNIEMFDRAIDASNVGKWRHQLDWWSVKAVEARFGGGRFRCLDRYQLRSPGGIWRGVFGLWHRVSELYHAVGRRLPWFKLW